MLFGSDLHADEVEGTLKDHERIFTLMGWNAQQIACVMGDNARKLFDH